MPADTPAVGDGWRQPTLTGERLLLRPLAVGDRDALRHVDLIEFQVGEGNLPSRRAMEKIGGRLADRMTVVEMADGPARHVIYEITRDSFAAGPLSSL